MGGTVANYPDDDGEADNLRSAVTSLLDEASGLQNRGVSGEAFGGWSATIR